MILFEFSIGAAKFKITAEKRNVILKSIADNIPSKVLSLPFPGSYNTSTESSTYDERGNISLNFELLNKRKDRVDILVEIKYTNREYWYYGSFDDDWHPTSDYSTKKLLSVSITSSSSVNYSLKSY